MSDKTLKLKIITPERSVFEDEVNQVTLKVTSGEITVLANHIPYVAFLKPGEILIKKGSETNSIAVSGGFVEFSNNEFIILADTAEHAKEIDLARAQEAKELAEKLKKEKVTKDEMETARIAALVEKQMARIKVAQKHHTHKAMHLDK